jgi:hypothetical protein
MAGDLGWHEEESAAGDELLPAHLVMPDLIRHPPSPFRGRRGEKGGPRIKPGVTIPAHRHER